MASVIGHAAVAAAIATAFPLPKPATRVVLAGMACAILPDIDAIGYALGVPYSSLFGHRGLTHSLAFAVFLAGAVSSFFFEGDERLPRRVLVTYLFLAAVSHGVLDAMTNGGLGVAFFSPFTLRRFFLPWRPIEVSPIGVTSFFGLWGLRVLRSEILWIGLPSALFAAAALLVRRKLLERITGSEP